MSDGELVARIVAQTTFRITPHGTEEIVNIEGVRHLIRESKAEWVAIEYKDKHDPHTTPDMTARSENDWFKKWFGDI